MDHALPVTACPPSHELRHFETEFEVPYPREDVWAWLCDPATFVDGQIWPYEVEFLDPETGADAPFVPGVLTNHHGPLLNFAGVIGEMRPPEYRDLHYTYGAFFVSPRVCRPVRLQMWLTDRGDATLLRVGVDAQIRRGLGPLSDRFQRAFWPRLGDWASQSIERRSAGTP